MDILPLPKRESRLDRRRKVARLARVGIDGERLELHRALARRNPPQYWLLATFGVPLLLSALLLWATPGVLELWHQLIAQLVPWLDLKGTLGVTRQMGGVTLPVEITWLDLEVGAPTSTQWWSGFALTAGLCTLSFVLPGRWLPLAYGLRLIAIVMTSSLAYFALTPASFPYSSADHISALLSSWLVMAVLIPLIYGLTYNVLGFSHRSRILLVLLCVGFMLIAAPLLCMAHAVVLWHGSLLFQPVLFLLFGLFPGLTAMVAFYSWAMTWEPEKLSGAVL